MSIQADCLSIFRSALAAVDPGAAVERELHHDFRAYRAVRAIAVGKAAAPMAAALEAHLGSRLDEGLALTKDGHGDGFVSSRIELLEGAHPVLEPRNLVASKRIAELADRCGAGDLVVVLLSGGASALLELPAAGVTFDQLRRANEALLRSGAPITEVNAVRQRLSSLKGGGLLAHIRPAACLTLILSDVVGSPLWAIGSGPTVAPCPFDPEPLARACGIALPPPGPRSHDCAQVRVVADARVMAEAAVAAANTLGYRARLWTAALDGEARDRGRELADLARDLQPGEALIAAGETVVRVHGSGRGGRCTELALSFALAARGLSGLALLAGASDGTDGPTDGAGAIVTGQSATPQAQAYLDNQDSYSFFESTGELLRTGPTGTNTNDLVVLLRK